MPSSTAKQCRVQEVPALLREATVLVQTSENENFGSSVAEALACGTPVVVGPSNGTADYIDEHSMIFGDYEPRLGRRLDPGRHPGENRAPGRGSCQHPRRCRAVVRRAGGR